MPTTSDTITLRTPYPDGTNGQHKDYTLADFDAQHQPVSNPPFTVFSNSQNTLVSATFNPLDSQGQPLGPNVLRVKTIAPKPSNIGQATIKLRDGRNNPGTGQPFEITITVNLVASPDGSSFEIATASAIVDD